VISLLPPLREIFVDGSQSVSHLEPGHKLVLAGEKNGKQLRKSITVLSQTRVVDSVETRVVLERETIDGEIFELSRNYFAICNRANSVFYFGEDVDFFVDRLIVGHDGSWRAGVHGAKAGVVMPGIVPETV
jgi:hypothetical protein